MKQLPDFAREEGWGRFLLTGFAIGCTIWIISILGVFQPLDGFFYDIIMRLSVSTGLTQLQPNVVLVEIPPTAQQLNENQLVEVISILNQYHPRAIAINYSPGMLSVETLRQLKTQSMAPLVFGIPLEKMLTKNIFEKGQFPLGSAQECRFFTGIVGLPEATNGISRRHHARYSIEGQSVVAMEVLAAQAFFGKRTITVPKSDYLVYFRGKADSLPRITLERVQKNDLVRQLIEGQCILLGRSRDDSAPGLFTPTTSPDTPMSFLEFQGHAINTLISGQGEKIIPLSNLLKLPLFLFIVFFSLPLYHRVFMRMVSWLTLLMLLAYPIASYFLFIALEIWLPVGELMVLQAILFIFSLHKKNVTADRGFQDLLLDMNAKLRERYYPTSIYRVKEHWAQVIAMVTQTLSLKRLIFLERVPRDHRVKEVESFNCSFDEIDERRRDYHRYPYSDAIKQNGPIQLTEKRPYLKIENETEEQYLVPLSFAGEILGFWAFGIDGERVRSTSDFQQIIRDYAYIIGELLYNRQEIIKKEARSGKMMHYLTVQREHEAYRAVQQTITFLKRRFDNLANLFNDLTSFTIVYDLFGRVLEVNKKMLDLLKSLNMSPFDMTSADLVSRLTGNSLDEIQQLLRKVINDRRTISFIIDLKEKHFTLYLRPLEFTTAPDEYLDPTPFGINGIVFEMVETTSMMDIHEIKKQLYMQLNNAVADQLTDIQEALVVLQGLHESQKEKHFRLVKTCLAKIQNTLATVDRCQSYISSTVDIHNYAQILPVNPIKAIHRSLEQLQPKIQSQQVSIATAIPETIDNVMATPEFLRQVLEHILLLLLKDTQQRGVIHIRVSEVDEWIRFELENINNGFGIPGNRFLDDLFLATPSPQLSTEIKNLRESLEWIKSWGGILDGESQLGKGTRLILDLARYV